ncbi:MAG: glycosyltransferase [Proteobacteria bacterium]|nr:glycosyltransferase [Pseudomonadota bacterium]
MSGRKRIIFAPASGVISHVVRCLVIGRALKERGHEIIFAGLPRYLKDPSIVSPGELGYYPLPDFDTDEAMEALRSIKRPYTKETILNHIQEELKMFEELRPDLAVSDFRLTMYISARVAKVPLVSILNTHWVSQYFTGKYHAPDTHPIPLAMKKVLGKSLADASWIKVLNLLQRYKLAPYYHAFKQYHLEKKALIPELVVGDFNLILDTELLGPTRDLPANFLQSGPVIWSPDLPLPSWVKDLDRKRPVIYVTMGSSGHTDLFRMILDTFRGSPYQVIISTGGQIDLKKDEIPEGFYVEKYLPGEKIMEMADVVICHGGNQTVYQAVQAGTPAIIIATHLDQEWGGEMLEEHQAGIFLTIVKVMKDQSLLKKSVDGMFEKLDVFRANMGQLKADLARYDPVKQAADGIEQFLDGKVTH